MRRRAGYLRACAAAVALTFIASALTGCTRIRLRAQIWKTTPDDPQFPEDMCDDSHASSPPYCRDLAHLADRTVGVAFSGGGARAATAALGQLRALHALTVTAEMDSANCGQRWIDRVKYVSAVSGGAWTATAYTFLPSSFTDREFLGDAVAPASFGPEQFATNNGAMEVAISRGSRFEHLFGRYLRRAGSDAWGRAIADTFLTDFDLNEQRAWFTAGEASRTDLISRVETAWWVKEARILIPAANRPFFIANATILANNRLSEGDDDLFPLEITPLYAGSAGFGNPTGPGVHQFGGGFIHSFAMDAEELRFVPSSEWKFSEGFEAGGRLSTVAQRFTLSDLMGATSSAAVETIARKAPFVTSNDLGFAYYNVPPIGSRTSEANTKYSIGDGAHLDNLGLLPLLARRVERILVLVNTPQRLIPPRTDARDWWTGSDQQAEKFVWKNKALFLDDLRALFDFMPEKSKVVAFQRKDFIKLYRGLYHEKSTGGPPYYCSQMDVRQNRHFGVGPTNGGTPYRPMICWVYLDRSASFVEDVGDSQLNAKDKHAVSFGSETMPGYPHFATAFGDGPQIVDLETKSIAALAHLTEWALTHRAAELGSALFGALPAAATTDGNQSPGAAP